VMKIFWPLMIHSPFLRTARVFIAETSDPASGSVTQNAPSAGFSGVQASAAINPLLTAGALAPWIALGMVVATALIAGVVKAVLKGERASAVQSATGFYYLAVVTAFTAEVAVKTRFLDTPGGPVH